MLNNKFFNTQSDDEFLLGDLCHQQQKGAIPVWVITDLKSNILISNKTTTESAWVVTGGRITINRMFQASTAMLLMTAEQIDFDKPFPKLPSKVARSVKSSTATNPRAEWGVTNGQGGILDYPLDKNDEIAIWCGYIEKLRPVVKEDLTSGRLIRRFVGAIDTLTCNGTPTQGVTLIIQCRDRIKYLMDSIGTFNTSDFDPLSPGTASASSYDIQAVKDDGTAGNPQSGEKVNIRRADVILEIACRCIGHLAGSLSLKDLAGVCDSVCGTKIFPGYISEYTQDKQSSVDFQAMYDLANMNNDYIGQRNEAPAPGIEIKAPFIGGKTRTKELELKPDLTFNIITGRLPYKVNGMKASVIGSVQNITDRVPAEFIKFLSFQEPWPTEFFCDARSGEYWYAPRGLDISGLVDPKRFYRTYFFRNAPADAIQHLASTSEGIVENYRTKYEQSKATAEANELGYNSADLITVKLAGKLYSINKKRVIDRYKDIGSGLQTLIPFLKDDITAKEKEFIEAFADLDDDSGNGFFGRGDRIKDFIERNTVNPKDVVETAAQDQPTLQITQPNVDNISNAIHSAQAALLYREESSAINWRSNIIVVNQPTDDTTNQSAVHLKLTPAWLKGRNFPCSYFQAVDTTVGNNQAELVSVAFAYARIFSKELKAATLHITGDPSIVPGEAIQVIGSPLHPEALTEGEGVRNWKWDRNAVVDYVSAYRDLYTSRLEAHKKNDQGKGQSTESTTTGTTTQPDGTITESTTTEPVAIPSPPTTSTTDPNDAAAPVRAVKDKLNNVQTIAGIDKLSQASLMCPATFGREKATSDSALDTATSVLNNNTLITGITDQNVLAPSQPAEVEKDKQDKLATAKDNLNLNSIELPEDPKTIWRVEAVIEKFNEDQSGSGYRTELALLSPF